MATIEVKVPDIGDFKDVPVISVMVKEGDTISKEDPIVELESDKATMEVPSPEGGTIKELKVKEGDKVAEGSVLLLLETSGGAAAAPSAAPAAAPAASGGGGGGGGGDKRARVAVTGVIVLSGGSAAFAADELGHGFTRYV